MTKTSAMSIRIDTETKERAEIICRELGTNISSAVNIFLSSFVRNNGFPFELKIETPNNETIEAMKESGIIARSKKSKNCSSADELMEIL
ncbi:MAG: type II toxin-antitoxin system RelB/DinJ family antitoxin [Methanocorpusculum sp.]|nr:type II toxin-antitoxin system RelB/DinJ family antitoxin [Methanocorpusculum sp.]